MECAGPNVVMTQRKTRNLLADISIRRYNSICIAQRCNGRRCQVFGSTGFAIHDAHMLAGDAASVARYMPIKSANLLGSIYGIPRKI